MTNQTAGRLGRAARFGILPVFVALVAFGLRADSIGFIVAYALVALVLSPVIWFVFDHGHVPPDA